MNKFDISFTNYMRRNCFSPLEILIVQRLYYYGTISWKNHDPYTFFHKSIRDMANELSSNKETVQIAYKKILEHINQELIPFFEIKIEPHKNFSIYKFRVDEKKFEIFKKYYTEKPDSETSNILKNQTVKHLMYGKSVHDCTEKPDGINIITHSNSMYDYEPVKSEVPEIPEIVERQTDEFQKEKVEEKADVYATDLSKGLEIWKEIIKPKKLNPLTPWAAKKYQKSFRENFNSDLNKWREHCTRISESSFLMGESYNLNLDWVFSLSGLQSVKEGRYDDHEWRRKKKLEHMPPVTLREITLNDIMATCQNDIDKKVKPYLYNKLGAESYATWIHYTGASFYEEEGQIQVNSCGKFTQTTIKTRFWREIESAYS